MRKLLLIRRIIGDSMVPTLNEHNIVIGSGLFTNLVENDLVLFHHEGLDKIKRISKIGDNKIFVVGDNNQSSRDSRVFGWIPLSSVQAKIIWPRASTSV